MIYNQPLIPPIDEYKNGLDFIWNKKWLTNNGDFVKTFEDKLKNELNALYLSVVSSGTMAIMIASKSLGLKGDVIISELDFPAVRGSLQWIGLNPIFCSIESKKLTIDTSKLKKYITSNTCAILATHLFSNICDIENIQTVAEEYNLKVIYDASHCFGMKIREQDISSLGDITIFSLHATKLLHTIEGGLIVCRGEEILNKINLLRNFGIVEDNKVVDSGINGKMSEFHALMGLCLLDRYKDEITKRKKLFFLYKEYLSQKSDIQLIEYNDDSILYNYQYCVIKTAKRDTIWNELLKHRILTKKFFYNSDLLLLPLYSGLAEENVEIICNLIKKL